MMHELQFFVLSQFTLQLVKWKLWNIFFIQLARSIFVVKIDNPSPLTGCRLTVTYFKMCASYMCIFHTIPTF